MKGEWQEGTKKEERRAKKSEVRKLDATRSLELSEQFTCAELLPVIRRGGRRQLVEAVALNL